MSSDRLMPPKLSRARVYPDSSTIGRPTCAKQGVGGAPETWSVTSRTLEKSATEKTAESAIDR